jgi:uncharacterized protein involved in response to NO
MMLAVMTRATLGHTGAACTRMGRPTSHTFWSGWLLCCGSSPRGRPGPGRLLLETSAACWIGAFALFGLRYGPVLAGRKA